MTLYFGSPVVLSPEQGEDAGTQSSQYFYNLARHIRGRECIYRADGCRANGGRFWTVLDGGSLWGRKSQQSAPEG